MTVSEMQKLWADFCLEVAHIGYGMIWRAEVQGRGSLHWHCIGITPAGTDPLCFKRLWDHQLDKLGAVIADVWIKPMGYNKVKITALTSKAPRGAVLATIQAPRSALPGADKHSTNIQEEGGAGAWLRYLQDHASKAKQGQIGENIGRHWGVVGRKHWVSLVPDSDKLTVKQFSYVLRHLQRLSTPSFKCKEADFGRVLGGRNKRGCRGTSVWFSKPETVKRLVVAAKDLFPEDKSGVSE